MLIEIAVGDAYGAGFEFCEREKIARHNHLNGYCQHPLGIPAGRYTDDTQMSIALVELMLGEEQWNERVIADKFVGTFKRDPRLGYAKGMQQLLTDSKNGDDFLLTIRPTSTRNGAAMRSVPLGLIQDEQEMKSKCEMQARITHNTEEGILSAVTVAYIAHYFIYKKGPVLSLGEYLQQKTQYTWRSDWEGEVECNGIQTVNAVITALLQNKTLSTLLKNCVNFGGDVDSVAAIALGAASFSEEYENDIPANLYSDLEQGPYGLAFLKDLDSQLTRKFSIEGHSQYMESSP